MAANKTLNELLKVLGKASSQEQAAGVQQEVRAKFMPGAMKKRRLAPPTMQVHRQVPAMDVAFVALSSSSSERTPTLATEAKLFLAGLGRRHVCVSETDTQESITGKLEAAFPKLKELNGGFQIFKATAGGQGSRAIGPLPWTDQGQLDGPTLVKLKNPCLYVVPMLRDLSDDPLAENCEEFLKLPKVRCERCLKQIPTPLLVIHDEACAKSSLTPAHSSELPPFHQKAPRTASTNTHVNADSSGEVLIRAKSAKSRGLKKSKLRSLPVTRSGPVKLDRIRALGDSIRLERPNEGSTHYLVYALNGLTWKPEFSVWLRPSESANKKGGLREASFWSVGSSTGNAFTRDMKVVIKRVQDHVVEGYKCLYPDETEFHLVKRDCQTQTAGRLLLTEFRRLYNITDELEIIDSYVACETTTGKWVAVEQMLEGTFHKFSSNNGKERLITTDTESLMAAFSHWTLLHTDGNMLVVDLQGVGGKMTDIQVVTADNDDASPSFTAGNTGTATITKYKQRHICGEGCRRYGLPAFPQFDKDAAAISESESESSN